MKSLKRIRPLVIFISCILVVVLWQSFAFGQNETSIAGIWNLTAQGVSVGCTVHTPCQTDPPFLCGTAICGSFEMGDPDIHVSQSGSSLYASEEDVNGNLFTLTGNISGTQVTFTIVGNGITPGIGNATTTYTGTLSGDNITGSFFGFASWTYDVGKGNLVTETATWTGTFMVTISSLCDFSTVPGIERCFGGIGTQCEGDSPWPGLEFDKHYDTCLVDGWMSVGSILHDTCCKEDNTAFMCATKNTKTRICRREFILATLDVVCHRFWEKTFGPYPVGNDGDVNPDLKAPSGARVQPYYQNFCTTGKCRVNARGRTIIYGKVPCRYCVCE
jgi:hypothetical protein